MAPSDDIDRSVRRTAVPESLLGYIRQLDRALVHLLDGRAGDDVSLEVFGDIGVLSDDGSALTEEAKSRTGRGNPLANRAVDLWKTFRNWIDAVEDGHLCATHTVFQLYVSRPFPTDIAARLAQARTPAEVEAAFAYAWAELEVDPTSSSPSARVADGIREHVTRVLQAPRATRDAIFSRFRIEVGTGEADAELRGALDGLIVSDAVREQLMVALRGWVLTRVVEQLERGGPAHLAHDEFRRAVIEYRTRIEKRDQLLSVAADPHAEDMERELALRVYVKQLDLIDVEEDEKSDAVIDFLTASTDRVAWAAELRVFEEDLVRFEREIRIAWRRESRQCHTEFRQLSEVDRGRMIFTRCAAHQSRLAGLEIPEAFCRGNFHKLADERAIGWHPDFLRRLDTPAHHAGVTTGMPTVLAADDGALTRDGDGPATRDAHEPNGNCTT